MHWQADSLPPAPPSPKILSSRFNSVSKYRGRIHLQCEALLKLVSEEMGVTPGGQDREKVLERKAEAQDAERTSCHHEEGGEQV